MQDIMKSYWKYFLSGYKMCDICLNFVCIDKEVEKDLKENSKTVLCTHCNKLLLSVYVTNWETNDLENNWHPVMWKQNYFEWNDICFDGNNFFLIHYRDYDFVMINYGIIKKMWVEVDNKSKYFFLFVRTSKIVRVWDYLYI